VDARNNVGYDPINGGLRFGVGNVLKNELAGIPERLNMSVEAIPHL
jgi:hypothetical protein